MPKRILVLLTVAAMMALMMALSDAALAQPDVCVSVKGGEEKVQKGTSTCFSDSTSQSVAVNGSTSLALDSSTAVAVNDSLALALAECTIVTTQPGELDVCVF